MKKKVIADTHITKAKLKTKSIELCIGTLNREATDENLYDDLNDSSGKELKSPETSEHLEDDKRLQCSATI